MKVALYARVSTKDKGQDPENQLRRLRQYCESQGWEYQEFADQKSGKDSTRPQLIRMMSDLDKFDGILVLRLDRFGRSLQHVLQLLSEIRAKGKFFTALDQALTVKAARDPMSEFMLHILGAAAEFERDLISERVRDGINRAKGGNPGQKVNGRKSLEEKFFDRIPRIHSLRLEGRTIREISQLVGVKRSSVQKILSTKYPPENDPSRDINPLSQNQQVRKEIFLGQEKREVDQ